MSQYGNLLILKWVLLSLTYLSTSLIVCISFSSLYFSIGSVDASISFSICYLLALSSSLPLPSHPVLGAVKMSAPATPPVPLPYHVVVVAVVVGCWKCQRYQVEEIQVLARHGWL